MWFPGAALVRLATARLYVIPFRYGLWILLTFCKENPPVFGDLRRGDTHITPWASYQIRKIAGCACAGNAGNVSPRRRFQRKPIVGDPGMHHGTCVTHVPWCMSGSLTCGDEENVPGIPGACAPAILRIWQEAHGNAYRVNCVPVVLIRYRKLRPWEIRFRSHLRVVF